MAYIETIQNLIGYIPQAIEIFRNLITKLIVALSLPAESTSTFVFLGLAIFLGYLFIKQFVVSGMFLKISTILNWILLSICFYLLLGGVRG